MGRVYAIAINTFREAVRDRVLYGVIGLAFGVLLFTLALAQLALYEQRRIILDVGLATISIFAVMVAIFLGSSLLYKEIDRKTLYVILSKPIARSEFLLGKYLGIVLTAATFVALMGGVLCWVLAVQLDAPVWGTVSAPFLLGGVLAIAIWRASDRTSVLLPWSALVLATGASLAALGGASLGPLLAALALTIAEVLVVASVAMFFSSFSSPFLTGALTLGVWVVGRSADSMVAMRSRMLGPELKSMLAAIAEVWPNLNLFVPGRHTLETISPDQGGPLQYVVTSSGYAILYSAVLFALAAVVFRRRDFL